MFKGSAVSGFTNSIFHPYQNFSALNVSQLRDIRPWVPPSPSLPVGNGLRTMAGPSAERLFGKPSGALATVSTPSLDGEQLKGYAVSLVDAALESRSNRALESEIKTDLSESDLTELRGAIDGLLSTEKAAQGVLSSNAQIGGMLERFASETKPSNFRIIRWLRGKKRINEVRKLYDDTEKNVKGVLDGMSTLSIELRGSIPRLDSVVRRLDEKTGEIGNSLGLAGAVEAELLQRIEGGQGEFEEIVLKDALSLTVSGIQDLHILKEYIHQRMIVSQGQIYSRNQLLRSISRIAEVVRRQLPAMLGDFANLKALSDANMVAENTKELLGDIVVSNAEAFRDGVRRVNALETDSTIPLERIVEAHMIIIGATDEIAGALKSQLREADSKIKVAEAAAEESRQAYERVRRANIGTTGLTSDGLLPSAGGEN